MKFAKTQMMAALLCITTTPIYAATNYVSVDWTTAGSGGTQNGTLGSGSAPVTLTNSSSVGGGLVAAPWGVLTATDGATGAGDVGIVNEGSTSQWTTVGTITTISLSGGYTITNPILLINFTNGTMTFNFADSLTLNVLDASPAASATIGAGNVITSSSGTNTNNDGFAVQITGTVSSISFVADKGGVGDSVGVSFMVDQANLIAPSSPISASVDLSANKSAVIFAKEIDLTH